MGDLPEPLVPSEVDLRDYDFMPLYGRRLFDSDTWALCNSDEKVAALQLWWSAWHEEPPGSLPNNDRLLSARAGYGVAVKAFLAVKENAMRGWIECSDGRLYHPVVASIALEVWQTKKRKKAENAADRERKKNKRLAGCPPEKPKIPPDIQPENPLKGREEKNDANASGGEPPKPPDPVKQIYDRGICILGEGRRSLLGKMVKQYTAPVVLAAIVETENEMPVEPASYFIGCCERRAKANGHAKQSAVDALRRGGARAAASVILRERSLADCGLGDAPAGPLLDGGG